jgi:hypothetical protein
MGTDWSGICAFRSGLDSVRPISLENADKNLERTMSTSTEQMLFTIFKAARDAVLEFFDPISKLIESKKKTVTEQSAGRIEPVVPPPLPSKVSTRPSQVRGQSAPPTNQFIGVDQLESDRKFTQKRASALLKIALDYDLKLKKRNLYLEHFSIANYILLSEKIAQDSHVLQSDQLEAKFENWFDLSSTLLPTNNLTVDESTFIVLTLPGKPLSVRANAFGVVAVLLHAKGKYVEAVELAEYSRDLYIQSADYRGAFRASLQVIASLLFAGQLNKVSLNFESMIETFSATEHA